jgi:hypothetical protein
MSGDIGEGVQRAIAADQATGKAHRPRRTAVVVTVLVGVALVITALAGVVAVRWVDRWIGPGCPSAEWQSSAAAEGQRLLPSGGGGLHVTKAVCDADGSVTVVGDAPNGSAWLAHVRSAATASGWALAGTTTSGRTTCYEKQLDGQSSSLTFFVDPPSLNGGAILKLGDCTVT